MTWQRLSPEVRAIIERAGTLACGEVHLEHVLVAIALESREQERDLSSAA